MFLRNVVVSFLVPQKVRSLTMTMPKRTWRCSFVLTKALLGFFLFSFRPHLYCQLLLSEVLASVKYYANIVILFQRRKPLSIFLVVTRKRNQAFVAFTSLTPHLLILHGRARKDTRGVHKTSSHYFLIHRTQRDETLKIAEQTSVFVPYLTLS